VLTIPENFSDLYQLPQEALNRIRAVISQDFSIRLEGPSQVSLFCYDNGTFIVESFLNEPVTVKIVADQPVTSIEDLLTGESDQGTILPAIPFGKIRPAPQRSFEITLKPHSYKVFKTKNNGK
jgi:hypothetical protein